MTSRNDTSTNSQKRQLGYDELSLHSHKSTNQSTRRSKQIQVSCSFKQKL